MPEENVQEMPIACTLSAQDYTARTIEIEELMQRAVETRELVDGYALKFAGSADQARDLLQFIIQERACCPFFTFELDFEPQEGPIWLSLRGPEGTKGFIQEMIEHGAGQ
jgi:hypothetical protein